MFSKNLNSLLKYNKNIVLDKWIKYTDNIKVNKTHPLIFKDHRLNNGKPYYYYAIIWCDVTNVRDGIRFTGQILDVHNKIHNSKMYIKDFPFLPKTFKIKIIQIESEKYEIIDDDILQEVYQFYNQIDEEWII